ncbi:hypothetical protein [Aeromonas veronii]|uniref:hypothetical protein n=1 Tax=Aeromonas veronii TaxID=654 RepID=UPI003D1C7088
MAGVWKRDGTVAVTNGSKKVTGTGTTFADAKNGVAKGHLFCMTTGTTVDLYEVDYVVSNTELHLVQAFRGTTGTGKAYEIITTFSDSIPEFARKLNASLSYYQSQSDMVQQLFTSDAAEITVTAPDGTTHKLIPWKRVTSDGEGQAARAKVEADRSRDEANRAKDEADKAAGMVALAALPMPDVWAPLTDSLRLFTGYGREVKVGEDVVARMVNFSRNSTATYTGKDGLPKTAAANEPRFEKEGLLIEGQSTNLIPTSATLTTQTVSVQAGSHTISFYGVGSVSLSGAAVGTLTGTGANARVELTVTTTAGNLLITVTGACTNGQLEALPFATSYIPTNGAAATRAADVCWIQNALNVGPDAPVGDTAINFALAFESDFKRTTGITAPSICGIAPSANLLASQRRASLESNGTLSLWCGAKTTYGIPGRGVAVICKRGAESICSHNGSIKKAPFINGYAGSHLALETGHVRNIRIWLNALTDEQIKAIK